MYLYRAVDSKGNTIDFYLSKNRNTKSAKHFFKKALASSHVSTPRVITVDKNPAYPVAIEELKEESFPYSNVEFAFPLPSENQECFLYGLKQLFHQAGGVPLKIRIDNLTPAVIKTRSKMEDAQLTVEFILFQN